MACEPSPRAGRRPSPGDAGPGDSGAADWLAGLRHAAGDAFDDDFTAVTAFQRHWLQSRCDGIADGDTRARLMALLRLAGAGA